MFAKRHEQDLAETRTLTSELDRRAREGLKQLEGIKEIQRAVCRFGLGLFEDAVAAAGERG